jgi:hypothetical protein
MEKLKLYQIFFDEQTRSKVNPLAIPYDNTWFPGKDYMPALESQVISQLFQAGAHKGADRLGVVSWALEQKHNFRLDQLQAQQYTEDVLYVQSMYERFDMWSFAEDNHPQIISLANRVFNALGWRIDFFKPVRHVIYENAHFTRVAVYEHYVQQWLAPVLEVMFALKADPILRRDLFQDSGYKFWMQKPERDNIQRVMGVPHYTFHAFICERLFSLFLDANPQYSVRALGY